MAYRSPNGPPGSPSALVFVSRVVLISLGLALIGAFLGALPGGALVLLLELASAGVAGMGVWMLARQRGARRRALENEQRSREQAFQKGGAGLHDWRRQSRWSGPTVVAVEAQP
jgi:hypothetical protein